MTLARALAVLAIVSSVVAAGATACSESGNSSSDAGAEGSADAVSRDAVQDSGATDARTDGALDGGTPTLIAFSVSESSDSLVTLVPQFSSSVHDYYVRCVAGTNALTVSMTASPGSVSLLTQPTVSPSSPSQTLELNVNENQAIVAVATDGTATVEYWVRCLPHDFPTLRWAPHPDAGTRAPGYYLIGTQEVVNGAGYAIVLDSNGVPVWYSRESAGVFDVDDVVDGAVSYAPFPQALDPFELHFLAPPATTDIGVNVDPHELRVLPDGGYLLVNSDLQLGVDLTGLSVPLLDGGLQALGPSSPIQACDLYELDGAGKMVWQWVGTDHFDAVKDSTWPQLAGFTTTDGGFFVETFDGGPIIDAFHCNSIDVDPANGNLLVSARHMDSVFYIQKSTGNVLWKMGGAAYTKDNATYVRVLDAFHRQHDARLLPGWSSTCSGAGAISLFDNETQAGAPARGVIYTVIVGSGDGGSTECDAGALDGGSPGATVAWEFKGATASDFSGSLRVSADGSRLIGWGANGVLDLVFTELDVGGSDLLDLYSPDDIISFRAVKAPTTAFDLEALRAGAGLP